MLESRDLGKNPKLSREVEEMGREITRSCGHGV